MVEWAQLTNLYDVFASIGSSSQELEAAIEAVATETAAIRRHVRDAGQSREKPEPTYPATRSATAECCVQRATVDLGA
jgi:hypothetical protein